MQRKAPADSRPALGRVLFGAVEDRLALAAHQLAARLLAAFHRTPSLRIALVSCELGGDLLLNRLKRNEEGDSDEVAPTLRHVVQHLFDVGRGEK